MKGFNFLVLLALLLAQPMDFWRIENVKELASKLGSELWRLSNNMTNSDDISQQYINMNASVKKKNGAQILQSSLRSVSTMLTSKINAVKCIHALSQKLAQEFDYTIIEDQERLKNFSYCSAKYSDFTTEPGAPQPKKPEPLPTFAENNPHYLSINLEGDSHFYDISVNTNTSCVHVPTNIYYKEKEALTAILWSKKLDEIFMKNYQSDPSLSWQYFGSSHGVFRFYPGMPWNAEEVDVYDCRVQSWYIEAATCSKDVIVLFDLSGSMTGFKNYVARTTLDSLLSTLSNNDYVNVYAVKNDTKPAVPCFTDFVQATPENLKTLKNALEPKILPNGKFNHSLLLEGNANLTDAFIIAFEKLKEKRKSLGRLTCDTGDENGCNQMVVLITDYVPSNLSEVFDAYNREMVNNQTCIPARVFTFLIGKDVTNIREIQQMACSNRGYFVHIRSVEEVQQQVLKYINVIARPMILAGEDPPPTWTHANIDHTRTTKWKVSGDITKADEDKLVTSVAIPAFDFKSKDQGSDAVLLGVASTDVPIDNIAKLAQPHQLGVNGYSFIVSNNGFLLLHPLLIATINGVLQENYNSVDFVEVEQVDDGKGPRELGEEIKNLRKNLVNGANDSMPNISVLFHYDNMRRIARVKHNYYFSKLEGTPFSMGISLPEGYGDTELGSTNPVNESKQGKNVTDITEYFRFNYRVHPDWVYCKYHYLEGHETENSEMEIWTFLEGLSKKDIDITKKQYENNDGKENNEAKKFDLERDCNTRLLDKEAYYCNEDLVRQLVFDAKLTTPFFRKSSDEQKNIALKYNVSVRFIATSSGLTRWNYVTDEDKNEIVNNSGHRHKQFDGMVFGDFHHNAIEETWYKAAVLQHKIKKKSLVIATRLPILDDTIVAKPNVTNDDGDITVTASYAIFVRNSGASTPASVIGFEFSYLTFYDRFIDLINSTFKRRHSDELSCGGDYQCYVIDSSGYVVLSVPKNISDVGQFFGVTNPLNGLVLQDLIHQRVFDHTDVFNYQALCPNSLLEAKENSAWNLRTPFSIVGNLIKWLITETILLAVNWNQYVYSEEIDYNNKPTTEPPKADPVTDKAAAEDTGTFSCDHKITLFILNQTKEERTVTQPNGSMCTPPYWASYIDYTNLLMVVVKKVDVTEYVNCPRPPNTKPEATKKSILSQEPCHKLDLGRLSRRTLKGCYTYHEKEQNITACGLGSALRVDGLVILTTAISAAIVSRFLI